MLLDVLIPRRFLFKFSLHVGVVTICSMGIMLYTISFFVNMFGRDPEFKDLIVVVHWIIVMMFIFIGFVVYILGFVAAYKESHLIALITTCCLIAHLVCWIFLTGLSFVNNLTINSLVCIDNRCADRLFIKNGNWRQADEHCRNPSDLRGILLGDIDIQEEEGQGSGSGSGSGDNLEGDHESDKEGGRKDEPVNDKEIHEEDEEERSLVEYVYDHGLGHRTLSELEKHHNLHVRGIQHNDLKDHEIVSRRKRRLPDGLDSSVGTFISSQPFRKTLQRIMAFNDSHGEEEKSNGTRNETDNNFLRTPIGKVGCDSPAQIAYSVICALLVLGLWYVYPILVFYSYTQRIKSTRKTSLPRSRSPEKSPPL